MSSARIDILDELEVAAGRVQLISLALSGLGGSAPGKRIVLALHRDLELVGDAIREATIAQRHALPRVKAR